MPENIDPATSPSDSADTSPSTDWQARYVGASRVLTQRSEALALAEEAREQLTTERDGLLLEVQETRAQKAAEAEEAQQLADYETLREKFGERPPMPISNSAARPSHWTDDQDAWQPPDIASGFPT